MVNEVERLTKGTEPHANHIVGEEAEGKQKCMSNEAKMVTRFEVVLCHSHKEIGLCGASEPANNCLLVAEHVLDTGYLQDNDVEE